MEKIKYPEIVNEAQFEGITDLLPGAIMVANKKGEIIFLNKQSEKLFGYKKTELLGEKIEVLLPEQYRKGHIGKRDSYHSDPHTRTMGFCRGLYGKHKNGANIPVDIMLSPVSYKGELCVVSTVWDITMLEKTEKELKESELRYRNFIANSREGIWRLKYDTPLKVGVSPGMLAKQMLYDGTIVECNDMMAKMYGYDKAEEFYGKRLIDLFAPKSEEEEKAAIERTEAFIKNGFKVNGAVSRERTRDGRLIHIENSTVGVVENGYLLRLWGVQRDVTERQQAYEEVKKAHTAIENSMNGVITADFEGDVVYANRAAAGMWGYKDAAEMIADKTHILNYHDKDTHPRIFEILQAVKEEGEYFDTQGLKCLRKDGSEFIAQINASQVKDEAGQPVGITGSFIDITEQKKTAKSYRTLLETMNEGVIQVDNEENIEYVNNRFCELVEYTREELIGKKANALLSADKETAKEMKEKVNERLKGETDRHEMELRKKSGDKVWIYASAAPVYDEDGNVIGSIGINTDITERKKAEEALIESNKELNTFIYKSSHDLRAPLASILGLVNVSEMEVKDTEAKKYFAMIKDRILTQDKILSELLRVSGIYEGKIRPEKFNPLEEVSEIAESLKNSEEGANVNFKIKDKFKKKLTTDRLLFSSIIHNLLYNAVKYRNSAIKKPHVHIEITGNGNGTHIMVEDNGIGIKKEVQPSIYDMFYRGHEGSKGSGLGLYIVKKAVDKLGGTIRLKSEAGKGSVFTVLLPDMKEN